MLYARANPVHTGQRYVQLSTADQGSPLLPSEEGVSTWSPFQMIRIDNYAYCDGDIYFFLVQQNPVLADSLLALFPVVHRSSGCIAFAVSRDGVRWSAPAPLLRCATDDYSSPGSRVKLGSRHSHTHVGQRSLHQPAANLHLVGRTEARRWCVCARACAWHFSHAGRQAKAQTVGVSRQQAT